MVPTINIVEALDKLDSTNDEQWTAQGLPRVEIVTALLGVEELTRKEITEAAPDFTREAVLEAIALAEIIAEPDEDGSLVYQVPHDEPEDEYEVEVEAPVPEPVPVVPSQPLTELERLQARLAEKTEEMFKAQRVAEVAKDEANQLANDVNKLNRTIDRYEKADPNSSTAGIRAYIAQQNKNRIARMAGLHAFVKSTGSKPADVQNAIDPRAPIDRAMGRRSGYGHERPKRV